MIEQADAVVIGAGALGLATAWHLAALGVGTVAVLDQYELGSQTSPRAAGLFKQIQADEARTRLAQLAVRKVLRFEEETGVPLAVVRSGSLLLACSDAYATLVATEYEQSRGWGVELELVDGAEAQRLFPALAASGLTAACHTPGDVYIEEPGDLLRAWIEALRLRDAALLPHTRATGIRVAGGAVTGVETDRGTIRTELVVDAAGAWARQVGELAGITPPVAPVRHQLAISQPVAGVEPEQPILRLVDSAVYVRPARGGLMLGGFEEAPLVVDPRRYERFAIEDLPLDLRVVDAAAASVAAHLPVLRDLVPVEHRGGLFTMTPDGRFLAGPAPGVRGLWLATGCNGTGFSLSPAIGQMLAEWITTGSPSIDMRGMDPSRFADLQLDEDELERLGVWQYTHYYALDAPPEPA